MTGKQAKNTVSGRRCAPSVCFALMAMCQAGAQQLPQSPTRVWEAPKDLRLSAPVEPPPLGLANPSQPLPLAALIDIAERRNPETRVAWEQARQQAALKGVARAALFPTLVGLVLGQTTRTGVLLGAAFVRQTEGLVEPALELDYTVFDWNARLDALRAARFDLFGADFAFNNVHLEVIESVSTSYFQLLNSQGQIAAAEANLENAQSIAGEVDARFANGLATLPDALEARAAAAQAGYELASLQGAQSNSAAQLATTLRLPASTVLPIVPLAQLAPPEALADTAAEAIARALSDRPDLLQRETRIAAADQRIRQARTAYLPQIDFMANWGRVRAFGEQDQLPEIYGAVGTWNAQLNLRWTLFDGGRRSSEITRARAEKAAAAAELEAERDRIENEVWTAYTNTQTAFAQQQAAAALLGAAQGSYAAAAESYADGVRTLVDVVTAERALAQARSEEVTARTNLFQQTTELAFRTGDLLRSHSGPAPLPPGPAPGLPGAAPTPLPAQPATQAQPPNGRE